MRVSAACPLFLALGMLLVSLAGCGSDRKAVAPVEGVVTLDGKPVTSGYVSFDPIDEAGDAFPGKSGVGAIGKDGRYQLSTYEQGDGAIVGRHRVSVTPAGEEDKSSLQGASLPEDFQVEVKQDGNEINLELTR